jgi:2-keto-4-pentenoate hydratase/2-oxohepta-3-ene-1,7-dioic acid hydratase in catechol pathway
MGLNYLDHVKESNMPVPEVPVLFIKPRTALNGPFPATINVPKIAQDGTSDYEAEMSIILSKAGRDIPEEEAMDYVLGYTCSNDVSARTQQFRNSQWSFSKGRRISKSLPAQERVLTGATQALMAPARLVQFWYLRL